jgi:hypothetical protein
MSTTTYKIPKRFIHDHEERGCLRGAEFAHDDENGRIYGEIIRVKDVLVKEIKSHYYVALTADQASELLSDANYYRDGGGGGMDFFELGMIISSARATYNALIKAGVTK